MSLRDGLPDILQKVQTRPLFVMRLDVRPLQIMGATPSTYRRVGVVPNGVFEGELLSGEVLDGGVDWQTVRSDGSITLDVRLVLKTFDDALIGMTYRGIRHGAPDVIARLENGETVDPGEYYFRVAPLFETAANQYAWLNNVIAIGTGHRRADGRVYYTPEQNKTLVLEAFDTLFNKRDYEAAARFWSDTYIQHSAHIKPGRDGLFDLIRNSPATLKYEPGTIVAEGDYVIVHGRFSGTGRPRNWIAADVVRVADGLLAEHWDVLQDEATEAESQSGLPMFGTKFPG
jgi:predicted SnoaL-like aldol condensation-catalyzing enzyme